MFLDFLRGGPKRFLGVDIGTSSIRIVELKRGNPPQLNNYGEFQIISSPKDSFKIFRQNSLQLSDEAVSESISKICSEAEMNTKEANFSIPDFSTFMTSLDLPRMDKDELYEAVKYESRPYIPLPDKEITLDWTITEGELSKTPVKVLVVAIPKDVVSQYQRIAQKAGLEIRLLEPEVFSLARNIKKEIGKNLGLIDIGARSTTCSILEKGSLKISHSFKVGGNQLTETLARSLDIGYNKANRMKEEKGIASEDRSKEILLPSIDSILDEVKKAFRDFYQKEGEEVSKVVLAGGISQMPGLKEHFSSELKKETEILDPFSNLSYPPVLKEVLKTKAPSYAVAVGAALKGFE